MTDNNELNAHLIEKSINGHEPHKDAKRRLFITVSAGLVVLIIVTIWMLLGNKIYLLYFWK